MSTVKLDLHGFYHDDARRLVIRFIELNWGHDIEVEIVTGNSKKMKNIITRVLDEYDLEYKIGREFDTNKGYIVAKIV